MVKSAGRLQQGHNPLTVIALLIGVVEAAFAYPVTKLTGANQTLFVYFMIGFPVLLLLCFFVTVWFKPAHLYGPKDYAQDDSFLRGIGRGSALQTVASVLPPDEPPPRIGRRRSVSEALEERALPGAREGQTGR